MDTLHKDDNDDDDDDDDDYDDYDDNNSNNNNNNQFCSNCQTETAHRQLMFKKFLQGESGDIFQNFTIFR